MKTFRYLALYFVCVAALAGILFGATWAGWNGVTAGAATGNVSGWNGGTIGTTAGNLGAWNGLLSPGGGPTGPITQCVSATGTASAGTITCSTTMNLVAGNLLAVAIRGGSTSLTITTVCNGTSGTGNCTGSDTFTAVTGSPCTDSATGRIWWYYAKNIAAQTGANITVTFGASDTYRALWVSQWSGLSVTAPKDQGPACAASTAGTTTPTTASFTTAHANEVLLTWESNASLLPTYTAGSGYTLGTLSVDKDNQGQWQIVNTIQTAVTGSLTMNASHPWQAAELTLTQ